MLTQIKDYLTKSIHKTKGQKLIHLLDCGYSPEEALQITLEFFNISPVSYGIKHLDAQLLIEMIISWVNEGWVPNWNDENQMKWYPLFNLSGEFSYYVTTYGWHNTVSVVGSLLCYSSKNNCEVISKSYSYLYKKMIITTN